jgi:hypothetical protein
MRQKVLVMGGGPGGLEAARVAALRGHEVTLYEREDLLGRPAPPRHAGARQAGVPGGHRRHLVAQCRKHGVRMQLGCRGDARDGRRPEARTWSSCHGSRAGRAAHPGLDQPQRRARRSGICRGGRRRSPRDGARWRRRRIGGGAHARRARPRRRPSSRCSTTGATGCRRTRSGTCSGTSRTCPSRSPEDEGVEVRADRRSPSARVSP